MPARALVGFVAAVAAIVVAVTAYFLVVADRTWRAARVAEGSERVLALQRLEQALVRAESAQRGYLLTREERSLEVYRHAVAEVHAELDGVAARVAAGARGPLPSDALAVLVEAKLAELRRVLDVRETEGLPKALRELRSGEGTWLTETTEAIRAEMEAAERAELGEHRRAWYGRVALADAIFVAANVLLLALVVGAGRAARAEIRLREERAQERLRLLEFQERVLGIVSHDLRTPLSAIRTGATLLSRAGLPRGEARIAGVLESSSRRMQGIIGDLLDYSRTRAETGIPLSPCAADAGEVCARVLEEASLAEGDGLVELQREGDLSGEWDAARLEQAIGNLVANGLRHARPGTPVRVRAVDEGERIRIDVENDGPPVPAAAIASLFHPFQGAAGPGNRPAGLGLGLFIVRTIVEAHGGTVELSAAARPVRFTILLPRRRPEAKRRATSPRLWRPSRPEGPRSGAA